MPDRVQQKIKSVTMHSRNADFYKNIVDEIVEMFGDDIKTSDDGSIQDDVLSLNVPKMVRKALENAGWERIEN